MTLASRTALRVLAALSLLVAAPALALPKRSVVARPLPPAVLAGSEDAASGGALDALGARALAESLLTHVSATRGLRVLRPVPVVAADRTHVRARLEAITRQDQIDARLRQEERLFRYLGLLPPDADLVALFYDLLGEQLAGFYDIDQRELVLADWLSPERQIEVVHHELAHALQDQHFSLRVRKKLGFVSGDAEAAWNALIEGDATAVMAEMALQRLGRSFTVLADSADTVQGAPAAVAAAHGPESARFRAAPAAVQASLGFPYVHGLRFVTHLYRQGGWKAVDEAFVHPPQSTEQILHPDRFLGYNDQPVRIDLPDVSAMLGGAYRSVSAGMLGEHDLRIYLGQYVDAEIAAVAAEGWGGCAYGLYAGADGDPDAFVLMSDWDSEDDAIEFFGGLIGALEARFPEQIGFAEASSQDQILWNLDREGKRQNVLRLRGRQVLCLETVPSAELLRLLNKLDKATRIEDPAPESRATLKESLPWNRLRRDHAGKAFTLRLALPEGWTGVEPPTDSLALLEGRRDGARLVVGLDRMASNELSPEGYAHMLADDLQRRGKDVYVQTDVGFPRPNGDLYQYVFSQTENGAAAVYFLGVADLGVGYGHLLLSGPSDQEENLHGLFYDLLGRLELVPEDAAPDAGGRRAADAGDGRGSR